jgi:hypothetical protein
VGALANAYTVALSPREGLKLVAARREEHPGRTKLEWPLTIHEAKVDVRRWAEPGSIGTTLAASPVLDSANPMCRSWPAVPPPRAVATVNTITSFTSLLSTKLAQLWVIEPPQRSPGWAARDGPSHSSLEVPVGRGRPLDSSGLHLEENVIGRQRAFETASPRGRFLVRTDVEALRFAELPGCVSNKIDGENRFFRTTGSSANLRHSVASDRNSEEIGD